MNSVVLIGKLIEVCWSEENAEVKMNVENEIVPIEVWHNKALQEKLANSVGNLVAIKGKVKMFDGDITIVAERVSVVTMEEK